MSDTRTEATAELDAETLEYIHDAAHIADSVEEDR